MTMTETVLPPFHFTIQMWGRNYTQPFTEITLPMILSPGNLPAIDNLKNCVFDLYTTSTDAPDITASAAFKHLESLLPVQVSLIDDLAHLQGHYKMSACNRRAIEKSDANGRIIVFLQPDTCMSNGTLKNMERVLKSGKRVVQIAGFRTQLEKMAPILKSRYRPESCSIQYSGRELIELAKDRLHPISETCLWDSDHFTNYNAHIYWRIGDEGFLARCAYFHPLAVYPRIRTTDFNLTIDYNYFDNAVPDFDDYYIVTDSDEMCLCEMSREHYFMGDFVPNKASPFQIAKWMEGYTNTQKPRLSFARKIYLHSGRTGNPQWEKAERFSDAMLEEAFVTVGQSLMQLLRHPHFLTILKERSRLYYHTGTTFHPSDRFFIILTSRLIPVYKLMKNPRQTLTDGCARYPLLRAVIYPLYKGLKRFFATRT